MFQNFVNTMLKISESRNELKVVNDQHGIPTSCVDLSFAIAELIEETVDQDEVGGIFHFSSSMISVPSNIPTFQHSKISISWADFARQIFALS
jgi:dTDP-4-dehydrorhamnose reductase